MTHSESISSINNNLFQFQSEVDKVLKKHFNPYFSSRYASLPDVLDTIHKPLRKYNLMINQFIEGDNEITTRITEVDSGEYIESSVKMPSVNDPQKVGSCITYYRRYMIVSMLGLNVDEDDDANNESGNTQKNKKEWLNPNTDNWEKVKKAMNEGYKIEDIKKKYKISKANEGKLLNELNQ